MLVLFLDAEEQADFTDGVDRGCWVVAREEAEGALCGVGVTPKGAS